MCSGVPFSFPTYQVVGDRHFLSQMGNSSELPSESRPLVLPGGTSPHKCAGAQSRLLRMHSVLAHALRTYSPGTDGQHYSNVVHVQAGRMWTSPLYQEAISLWKLYIHHHITPVALHLSGLQNTLVDQLSM